MDSEFVEDPLFRQRYRFGRDGDVLRIEIRTDAGGGVLADHVHPQLEERYQVLEGEVTFRGDRKLVVAGPGANVVVAPGVRHSFENTAAGKPRTSARWSRRRPVPGATARPWS